MTEARPRLPSGVSLVAASVVTTLLLLSPRYGFHRDELYFLVAGRRLDWGFVDQPPLTPLVARISEMLLGTSPTAIRVLPAVALGGVALLSALMARRFGGGATAQVAAALMGAGSGVALAIGHLLSTAAFDFFFWGLATYLFVTILDGADPRWWMALGATIGVAAMNKHLIAALAAAMLLGTLVTRSRSLLRSPWPWIGALIVTAIAMPNVVWQAQHGWPQLEMARALTERSDGRIAFVIQQIGLLSIVLVVPASIGLWRLISSPGFARWRPIGVAFVVLFITFLALEGKAYYVAPLYPVLLAAGACWFEEKKRRARTVLGVVGLVGIVAGTVIGLPIVPRTAVSTVDATGELGETVGWPELVDQVEAVYRSIPEESRGEVVIFTGSYGQAGAIEVLGAERGLPAPVSGHNNYWLWGPPDERGPVIGVGPVADVLALICDDVATVGTITNPWDVPNEEFGNPLLLCLEPSGGLSDVWDRVRHYN